MKNQDCTSVNLSALISRGEKSASSLNPNTYSPSWSPEKRFVLLGASATTRTNIRDLADCLPLFGDILLLDLAAGTTTSLSQCDRPRLHASAQWLDSPGKMAWLTADKSSQDLVFLETGNVKIEGTPIKG
jgi:hypothetical protein